VLRRLDSSERGAIVIKRSAVLAAFLLVACLVASSASAGRGKPASSTVSFVGGAGLSSTTCPFVPAGTTISWTGPETAIEIDRLNPDGTVTVSVVSHASGTATDNHGNSYAFDYSNAFRLTNSTEAPDTFTGTMTDHFSLAGPALQLNNGFVANVTTDFSTFFSFDIINSRGDPIDSQGNALCDPL
jgi:hypothetical protein